MRPWKGVEFKPGLELVVFSTNNDRLMHMQRGLDTPLQHVLIQKDHGSAYNGAIIYYTSSALRTIGSNYSGRYVTFQDQEIRPNLWGVSFIYLGTRMLCWCDPGVATPEILERNLFMAQSSMTPTPRQDVDERIENCASFNTIREECEKQGNKFRHQKFFKETVIPRGRVNYQMAFLTADTVGPPVVVQVVGKSSGEIVDRVRSISVPRERLDEVYRARVPASKRA